MMIIWIGSLNKQEKKYMIEHRLDNPETPHNHQWINIKKDIHRCSLCGSVKCGKLDTQSKPNPKPKDTGGFYFSTYHPDKSNNNN